MSVPTRIPMTNAAREGGNSQYTCKFYEDAVGAPQLDADAITAIVATLRDVRTGDVINSRDEQDVLDANDGSLAVDGTFTLQLGALDNIIVTPRRVDDLEEHELSLLVTYNKTGGGEGKLPHAVRFFVVNMNGV